MQKYAKHRQKHPKTFKNAMNPGGAAGLAHVGSEFHEKILVGDELIGQVPVHFVEDLLAGVSHVPLSSSQ